MATVKVYNGIVKILVIKFLRGGDTRSGSYRMTKNLLSCQETAGRGDLKRWESRGQKAEKLYKNTDSSVLYKLRGIVGVWASQNTVQW